jgi:hypothetical protein
MTIKYEEITTPSGNTVIFADLGDGKALFIPTDLANSDYQRYLNPEAEQSTPLGVSNE